MPGLDPTQGDIEQFVAITQATEEDAVHFLESGATLEGALEDFYAAQTAAGQPQDVTNEEAPVVDPGIVSMSQDDPAQTHPRSGGMTLGGQPAEALPESWGKAEKKKVGRVGEWSEGSNRNKPAPTPRGGDGGSDDEDQEFYTGGEKSGLAVQEPGKPKAPPGARGIVDNILKQAQEQTDQPKPRNSFAGQGNTLGTDETPTPPEPAQAPQPSLLDSLRNRFTGPPAEEEEEEVIIRHLTFWRNGFSIEDGDLYAYDTPGNKELLEAIQSGRAPTSLFGVKYNQTLQLEVAQKTDQDWVRPPKVFKSFEGGGNRLGSPAPEVGGSSGTQGILQGGTAQARSAQTQAAQPQKAFEVDDAKPTTSIQVRLGDGTRMVAKVNLDHTIADLRSFVAAARSDTRPFILQTTFPSKELADHDQTVEAAKLQNAVVVQRFV